MKTNMQCWSYLAQFLLERKTFQAKVVEKIKTHIFCSICLYVFFLKPAIYDNVEECYRAEQATDDNMAHAHSVLDT